MTTRFATVAAVGIAVALLPVTGWAQKGDLTHNHPAEPSATVGFGVLALEPIGPPPCVQVGDPAGRAIGGPADPCAVQTSPSRPRGSHGPEGRRSDVPDSRGRARDGHL